MASNSKSTTRCQVGAAIPVETSTLEDTNEAVAVVQAPYDDVNLLGSHENGMTLIAPTTSSKNVLDILQQINRIMQERQTKTKFRKWIQKAQDNSARRIQGGRWEIFLEANGKSSEAFDTIVGKRLLPPVGAKQLVLDYARRQALKDPRLQKQQGSSSHKFGNFSLIVSYDSVAAQAPHIDLIKPNHQFGLMVSNGAASTQFLQEPDSQHPHHIHSVDALVENWRQMATTTSTGSSGNNNNNNSNSNPQEDQTSIPPPASLVHALKQEPAVQDLLHWFGDVLLPSNFLLSNMKKIPNLPTGTLLSLPGSVVHAAPPASSFRAVIFFSGWPSCQAKVPEYNPDTQYTGVLLAGQITSLLWSKPNICQADRIYLLQRLAQYIDESTVGDLSGHFDPGNLADFVHTIEHRKMTGRGREKYITKMANTCKSMGFDTIVKRAYELLSVPGLVTQWEQEEDGKKMKEFHVEIYRRTVDGKVMLRYPPQHGEDEQWEGFEPQNNYQLIMNKGWHNEQRQGALFDGTNGKLLDDNGDKIDAYRRRESDAAKDNYLKTI